tara:strand:+ start:58 stop:843 length:786 start_codon:yes stop_codon:yes gene_type:complete
MSVIGIIPARMAASRFPGKPMEKILGMPMIGHCYYRTCMVEGLDSVYVATCDTEIFDYIESIGGKSLMTSKSHTRATTRTAEAMEHVEKIMNKTVDVVVMVQGDEPLIPPNIIAETLPHFKDIELGVVNIMSKIRDNNQFVDRNNVKVVCDAKNNALYFSREPIPSPWKGIGIDALYMQTGIIAFRRESLIKFNSTDETKLERIESVDLNRILEMGGRVRMVPTDVYTLGIDTPEELDEAQKLMQDDKYVSSYLFKQPGKS